MKARDSKQRFVNHLGIKLQKRKAERKLKRGKKTNYSDGGNSCRNGSRLNLKTSKKKTLSNGISKQKSRNYVAPEKAEEKGFQTISSNSERLARLQEFVDRESGKLEEVNNKLQKSNNHLKLSDAPVDSDTKKNLIKDKQKLLSIRKDQDKDTKEITRLGNLLGLKGFQKKKVAPIFSDEFGDILADIEEGTMSRAKSYSDKGGFKKLLLLDSDAEESELSDSSDNEVVESQDTSLAHLENGSENYKDEGQFDEALDNGLEPIDEEDDDEAYDSEDNLEGDNDVGSEVSHSDRSESENGIGDDLDSDEGSDEDKRTSCKFFDAEAEESDGEESFDEKPIHDETKEYELAFEGGSSFVQSEYLNNGILDDIHNYSSNSGDDTDLEGFIVNDDFIEHESSDDDVLEVSELKLTKRRKKSKELRRKRQRIISGDSCTSSQEDESELGPNANRKVSDSTNNERELNNNSCLRIKGRLRIGSESEKDSDLSPLVKKTREDSLLGTDSCEVKLSGQLEPELGTEDNDSCVTTNTCAEKDKIENAKPCKKKKKKIVKGTCSQGNDSGNVLKIKKKSKVAVSGSVSKIEEKKKSKVKVNSENVSEIKKKSKVKVENSENVSKVKKKKKTKVNHDVSSAVGNGEKNSDSDLRIEHEEIKSAEVELEAGQSKSKQKLSKKRKKKCMKADVCDTDRKETNEIESMTHNENLNSKVDDGTVDVTEDIYGRLRDKEGNVIQDKKQDANGKYVPPALRKLMAMNVSEKKKEQLAMLKRNLKGLINRLAESNIAGILSQIESLYQKHSQNDMSDCLSQLLFESLVLPTLTPERLIQEHMLLIAVLSSNIGNQVGAHILTDFVVKLNDHMENENKDVSCKEYDNIMLIVANLFNFRVVGPRLIYDILQHLAEIFKEKEVELILLVLRTVGFSLRKEDPVALKAFITQIQSQAAQHQAKGSSDYTRITFMLEIINSIKNNNPSKVPNYDPTHVEHLKKLMRGLIHKGKNISPMYVTLGDILKSRSQGRWWIVGSAWSGGLIENNLPPEKEMPQMEKTSCMEDEFSERFKSKATKLQLTRPPRINILYILTEGSDDYLDAFDKLLQLKLPSNQEQEIFNVILLCSQKGKMYNEFYSYLACRMCKFNKRFKRLLQFAVWDKFEEIENYKPREAENLAKFLVHLIGEDGLHVTILKNLPLMEAGEQIIEFMKSVLKGLLLHPGGAERVLEIFSKVSGQPELKFFTQSLKVFISKFLISKKKKDKPSSKLLYERSQGVLELLSSRGGVSM